MAILKSSEIQADNLWHPKRDQGKKTEVWTGTLKQLPQLMITHLKNVSRNASPYSPNKAEAKFGKQIHIWIKG